MNTAMKDLNPTYPDVREYRFRAWDKDGNCFEVDDTFELRFQKKGRWFLMSMNTLVTNYLDGILEQWTGLEDREGNDIYEGDIVKMEDYPWTGEIHKVAYEGAGFSPFTMVVSNEEDGDMMPNPQWSTVIGNIHEHLELLKG